MTNDEPMTEKKAKKKVKAKSGTVVIHNITNSAIFTGKNRIEPGKCLDVDSEIATLLVNNGMAEFVEGMTDAKC